MPLNWSDRGPSRLSFSDLLGAKEARDGLHLLRDAGLTWFVTDVRSGKEHEIEAEHDIGLVFVDADAPEWQTRIGLSRLQKKTASSSW